MAHIRAPDRPSHLVYVLALAVLAALSPSTLIHAQGVRLSVAPAADHISWDDELGLDNATFYGGRLGIDFGTLAGLEGFYFTRSDIRTDLASTGLPGLGTGPVVNQDAEIANYGVDLTINLSPGRLVPFVKAGGGVFDISPESGGDFDQVMYQYGGGFKMDFTSRLRGIVYVEDARFKVDRYALVPGGRPTGVAADPEADETRSNLSIGAGLGFALGGSKFDRDREAPRERWSFASIPIEPFAGRLDFDDGSLEEQDLAGVRAGINLGNYLSLRGYYWRGVGSFFNDTDPVQSYGAETQFNFTTGVGPAPFLILGAGSLDFRPGFRDRNGLTRPDRTVLLAGVGLGLRLSDQFRLNIGVRDYIYSDTDLNDVSSTSDLRHNPLFSAGISFDVGRNRERMGERSSAERNDDDDANREPGVTPVQAAVDTPPSGQVGDNRKQSRASLKAGNAGSNISEQVVAIPVPSSGELYVRYGEPAQESRRAGTAGGVGFMGSPSGLTASDMVLLREEIRRTLGDSSFRGAPAGEPVNEARLLARMDSLLNARLDARGLRPDSTRRFVQDTVRLPPDTVRQQVAPSAALDENRLLLRIDSMISARMEQREDLREMEERLTRRIDQSLERQGQAPSPVIVAPSSQAAPVTRRDSVRARMAANPSFSALQPAVFSGISFEGPTQLLLGARMDMTPYVDWGDFALVPEFSFGLFNGTSVMGAANIQYNLPAFEVSGTNVFPMARVGLGFFRFTDDGDSSTEGVLNLTYGFSTPIGGPTLTGERKHLFVEHQGIDLFDFNRLLVGVQWRY
jgi:hypothetical protein